MTKRDLVKWLEKEKETALEVARERKTKMITQAVEAEYAIIGLDKFINEMKIDFENMVDILMILQRRVRVVKV